MKPSEFDGGKIPIVSRHQKRGFKVIPKNSGETKNHGSKLKSYTGF